MYHNAAIIAVFAFAYACVAARVERSTLSGPIIFAAVGFVLGPPVLGLLDFNFGAETLRLLAEATLAMVLFTDAAGADLAMVRRNPGPPTRLLLIGLPLTILFGVAAGLALLPSFGLAEIGLIAAILAPTDAALGRPVVVNHAVPEELRETLNLESGLNDGICVPIVLLLLGIAVGTDTDGLAAGDVMTVVVEEIGIGLAVGAMLTAAASVALRVAVRLGWFTPGGWGGVAMIALAFACFTLAQLLGGSGFIACFVGGLTLNILKHPDQHRLLGGAEATGDAFSLMTWVVFGAGVLWQVAEWITLPVIAYSVLSLTVVRIVPVVLSLIGTNVPPRDRLFLGWFGPRGLASVVFGIMILDEGIPDIGPIEATIACTIAMSVLAHGLSANPLVHAFSGRWRAEAGSASPSARAGVER